MGKLRNAIAIWLLMDNPTTLAQASFKTFYLLDELGSRGEMKEMGPFVMQTLNFFIVDPLDSKVSAIEKIELTLCEKGGYKQSVYEMLHETKFEPAELIAGVALIFRNIFLLHFLERGLIESEGFQLELRSTVVKTKTEILKVFPGISSQLDLFLKYFEVRYLSPWNPARYSDRQSRLNFGTGVDYISEL